MSADVGTSGQTETVCEDKVTDPPPEYDSINMQIIPLTPTAPSATIYPELEDTLEDNRLPPPLSMDFLQQRIFLRY